MQMMFYHVGDAIQFNENHQWTGCFGIIDEAKEVENDARYLVAVPMPSENGKTAFVYVNESEDAMCYIGRAAFTLSDEKDNDN